MSNRKDILDQVRKEYKKISTDCAYFLKKYAVIAHPMKGKIKFDLYDFQTKVLGQFLKYDKNIILKSRQLGISTLCAGYMLWMALFFSDQQILVVATKQRVAVNIIIKIKLMYTFLPNWMKKANPLVENNKQTVRFKNGSMIKAETTSDDSGRSEALSLLVIDEAAFISNIDIMWAGVQGTLSTGGKCVILSTPNGCVSGDTKVKIRHKITKEIKEIEIKELFDNVYC